MPTQPLRLQDAADWQGCVLAYGHFNTIHPGHIRYLRHARGLGEQLVVALIGDGKTKYAFQQQDRAEALSLLGIADALLLLKADELKAAIEALKPEVLVLGNEFKNNLEIQATLVQQRQQGRSVQFHAGDIQYATTDLLADQNAISANNAVPSSGACRRQGIEKEQLLSAINSWGATRLIVLGDTIVDQYAREAIGMSARLRGGGSRTREQKFHRRCSGGGRPHQRSWGSMRFHLSGGIGQNCRTRTPGTLFKVLVMASAQTPQDRPPSKSGM